jgi:hydroxymethylglutaryl-CoA lyase
MIPSEVRIVEVGPRDGLQNEKQTVPVDVKVALIESLANAGLRTIEAGSFVSPQWVPQMADTAEVVKQLRRVSGVRYPVLVPNEKGLEAALESGADDIAVFTAASETFCQRNINCSIAESLGKIRTVAERALARGLRIRGYISCVLGCPYEGEIRFEAVTTVAKELWQIGCQEISLGDTIGVGTPVEAQKLLDKVAELVPMRRLAVHFHDTWGQALANILACLQLGVTTVDSSVAGLGGCPYAPGAAGNVATEDVVYMLTGMGVETGVDLMKLIAAGRMICNALGRPPASKVALALHAHSALNAQRAKQH